MARLYLQEAKYRVDDRSYTALAFPNDSGGYELRNPFFKGTLGKKDLSLLHAPEQSYRMIDVYEGCFDFLAKLASEKRDRLSRDALVLNSTAMAERAIQYLKSNVIRDNPDPEILVGCYLDNDQAGRDTYQAIVA